MPILSVAEARRLPGVSFEASRTSTAGRLPRMDVTAFVGLAAAGPFDIPVRVEDTLRFREIFGPDLALTAAVTGAHAHRSLLGPTVEAYFANGGQVCWVVRVGARDHAVTSTFPVPGLVEWHPTGPRTARVAARSPGSAFDDYRVGATVRRRPLTVDPVGTTVLATSGSVRAAATLGLHAGQLLELRWPDGTHLWVPVERITPGDFGRLDLRWSSDAHWFRRSASGSRPASASHALSGATGPLPLADTRHVVDEGGASTLTTTTAVDSSRIGDVVVRPTAASTVEVFVVDDIALDAAAGSSTLRSSATWQQLPLASVPPAAPIAGAAILTIGLVAFDDDAFAAEVHDLDLTSGAARWWGLLPSDHACFAGHYRRAATGGEHPHPGPLDDDVLRPRFPLAAQDAPPLVLPLGLRDDPLAATRSAPVAASAPAAVRDGVETLSASWFLDEDLVDLGVRNLAQQARQRFFVDGELLRGIHAVIPLDDVAVLSVPDAAQTGWSPRSIVPTPPLEAPRLGPGAAPDDGASLAWDVTDPHLHDRYELQGAAAADFSSPTDRTLLDATVHRPDLPGCDPRWYRVRVHRGARRSGWSNSMLRTPHGGAFAPCGAAARGAPVLVVDHTDLQWHLIDLIDGSTITPPPDTAFELETGPDPDFVAPDRRVVSGPNKPPAHTTVAGTPDRDQPTWYRVRVRPEQGEEPGPWSRTVVIPAAPRAISVADDLAGSVASTTVDVHRALAALTTARLDLTALVSFPADYLPSHIAEHLAQVRAHGELGADGRNWVDLLHAHHPWVASTLGDSPVWAPPDGAVAGRMAAGALSRGAWIATVGQRLDRAVDVRWHLDVDDVLELRDHRVNSLILDRAKVVVVGNDTLADDRLIAPVTVRRLLIVVRRLVRREGNVLAFENNGPLLWSLVSTRFERLLGEMFRLGAFAGATPAEAFRVICDRGLNPPSSIDAGRLVVELQVAPSQPLEFLRVRFVQTDATGPDIVGVG